MRFDAQGDVEWKALWNTVPELVRHAAGRYGDREAVAEGRTRVSYAELGERVERAAAACMARGVRRGDRVAVWAPNTLDWIVSALGAVTAGAVLVPLNTRFKGAEAAYVLGTSRTKLLFVTGTFLGTSYVASLRRAASEGPGSAGPGGAGPGGAGPGAHGGGDGHAAAPGGGGDGHAAAPGGRGDGPDAGGSVPSAGVPHRAQAHVPPAEDPPPAQAHVPPAEVPRLASAGAPPAEDPPPAPASMPPTEHPLPGPGSSPAGGGPLPGLPYLTDVVVLADDAAPPDFLTWKDFLAGGEAVSGDAVRARTAEISPGDPSDIIYTSGTTGRPKGAVITHGQTLRAYDIWADLAGLREGDRYLIVNPFFHTFGYKAGIIACLTRGATMVPQPVFNVDTVLANIAAERISVLPGPPTLHQSLLDHPSRCSHDLTALRLVVTGAAVVPLQLVERLRSELHIATVLTAYGLSEASGFVTMCRRGDAPETVATTSGRAIPGTEVRVEAPPGSPGEVLVRGFNVMQGYFEDPAGTAAAVTSDGWLRTGDVGVLDASGNLRITDRIKDMFIVGGFNAYPAEIEQLLLLHPDIADAAVVGVPDPRLGEVGKAYVVRRHGATTLTADDVIAWSRREMANYKVPREVEFLPVLPRNASGKVVKGELRARKG
ncbi:fatty acid--CoA ligase family protein [Streptomyces sp. NPDC091272]|uniref:fatty acid--CoA ligase family protein n=1 Tax=Streptomyces sp. NPDC091272 TaxID=3365981 RepID=UPI0038026A80